MDDCDPSSCYASRKLGFCSLTSSISGLRSVAASLALIRPTRTPPSTSPPSPRACVTNTCYLRHGKDLDPSRSSHEQGCSTAWGHPRIDLSESEALHHFHQLQRRACKEHAAVWGLRSREAFPPATWLASAF
ncbi:hypothetical protein BP00DRAFT_102026 [Aspergillus indologenus CBS 114.80]|uniref:Uncharacterized protein n=1 Tax=Aspergillus indologenus CBS 114.80 TaxID=1450541 RepID=A0A2V5INF0_9EURO|nr:hypothetical protein BP00DRAFT_102026 [Aspergillus indologenus CBS 114.80]